MGSRSILLGLDPSTVSLGWAACDLKTGSPYLCGTVDLAKMRDGVWNIESSVLPALSKIQDATSSNVEVIYCEKLYVSQSRKITIILSEAIGSFLMGCEVVWPGVPRNRFVPPEWKSKLGLGHHASKQAVMERARHLGWEPDSQDAADAGCIASAGWLENEKGLYGA
jgi:Holliday junction resolvasome RuvABC endonuclease subunit